MIVFAKEDRSILHTVKLRRAKWIGHILRRNFLLKRLVVGKREIRLWVRGIQGRRCKQLLDDLKETRGYWKLRELALENAMDLS
jgi:hypothetical protein